MIKRLAFFGVFFAINSFAQKSHLISRSDFLFLKHMTKDVIEASRIRPGQSISAEFGSNQTGGTLIRPGGRTSYPAFWIRDYAMALDAGMFSINEQKHLLLLTAKTQSNRYQQTKWGTFIPRGAIADHIRIDDAKPIYFPGTYQVEKQGEPKWGMQPPFCDAFFFIHMAYFYAIKEKKKEILVEKIDSLALIDRLELAFFSVPKSKKNQLVSVNEQNRGVDFGFRDAIYMTGDLCFSSILKFQAAQELAQLFAVLKQTPKAELYKKLANELKNQIPLMFITESGLLKASTGKSGQKDVWSTALAAHLGLLSKKQIQTASKTLNQAYEKGNLSFRGNIRHILTSDDFNENTAWEQSLADRNTYQNGAYWGTPLGWVAELMVKTHPENARKLIKEYVQELRDGDFRKGEKFGSPWECFTADNQQNPVYMTSVACPYSVFQSLEGD
ncbi:hypothetical protein V7S76_12180 [Aquirufa sp. ROCK2-A2]